MMSPFGLAASSASKFIFILNFLEIQEHNVM